MSLFVSGKLFYKAGEGSGGGGGSDLHNLGYYADLTALQTAHPTGTDGDYAILGSTDTIWVWDSGTSAWVDSDQKGQVTSVNGQTGDVVLDLLPSQTGQSGKFLTTDGTDASWSDTIGQSLYIKSASLYYAGVVGLKGYNNNNDILQMNMIPSSGIFELEVKNNSNTRTGYYRFDSAISPVQNTYTLGKSTNLWANIYTAKINNGADITVPAVSGEMAVKQVNTTITLTAAGWSSNTQTVNVTGMTATGVVLVSPDPTDQSAYTSAGVLCTAQAAGTLTFTCSTTPSADLSVNVVML